jgi:hypothetical protein
MKRIIGSLVVGLMSISAVRAGEIKVEATMMTEPEGREVTAYTADARMLYVMFKTKGATDRDKIRAVWIADDVGDAAAPKTKIDETTIDIEGDTEDGVFSLSKPTNGWPIGKYHVEIYVNDKLVTQVKFEIKPVPKSTKSSNDEKEKDSGD